MLYTGGVRNNICYTREGSEPIYVIQRRGLDQYMFCKGGVRTNICYTKERSRPIYVIQRKVPD